MSLFEILDNTIWKNDFTMWNLSKSKTHFKLSFITLKMTVLSNWKSTSSFWHDYHSDYLLSSDVYHVSYVKRKYINIPRSEFLAYKWMWDSTSEAVQCRWSWILVLDVIKCGKFHLVRINIYHICKYGPELYINCTLRLVSINAYCVSMDLL